MTKTPEGAAVKVVLLGVPGMQIRGQYVRIGTRKALALMAALALDREVPRERLAHLLWPDLDTPAARRNLRREVFRLRGLGLVIAESATGALGLAPETDVDVLQLREAAALGDDVAALAQPLALLLDGLDGVAGEAFDERLAHWRNDLIHGRVRIRNRLADALAQSSQPADHQVALSLYRQALLEDRCNEVAALAAMRLHAAVDGRTEALALYARLVRALGDDLGVAPNAALQSLAAELRVPSASAADATARRPETQAAHALPVQLAAKLPFFPRPASQTHIDAACSGGRRVYLSGAPGVGKTRLASECAAARGPWLMVACAPNDVELAFSSGVRLLRALREAAPDVVLPDWARRELAQLMPEFGPAPQALATDEARARLVAAIALAWRLSVTDNFQTIVLDDWHWCDAASVELWNDLLDDGVAWIVVHRSAALPQPALQRMHADVDAGRAVALQVTGLEQDDVLAFIQQLSGSASGTLFAHRLHASTDGNPFFLVETLRLLFERNLLTQVKDGWSTPFDDQTQDYAELPIPATVRDAVLARVRMLGSAAQRLLEAAALLNGPFNLRLIVPTDATVSADDVAALEHAQAASLIVEAAGATGTYVFAHDLNRQCVADSLSPARKRLLHERLAQNLKADAAPPALIAAQFEAAGRLQAAVPWRKAAAHKALQLHALADAQQHFERALADGAGAPEAVDIHHALAQLHRRRGDVSAIEAALSAAVRVAAQADASTRLEAQLVCAEFWCAMDRSEDGFALLDALSGDLLGATAQLNARALCARASALAIRGDALAAQQLETQAIALLSDVPDAVAQLSALLLSASVTAYRQGDMTRSGELAARAGSVFEALGDLAGQSRSLTLRGIAVLFSANDRVQALSCLDRARVLAAQCGHVPAQRGAILNLIKLYTDTGQSDRALALLNEGIALAPGFEHARAELGFMEARYFVHYLRGELQEAYFAAGQLLGASDRAGDLTAFIGSRYMVVDLYLQTGDLTRAGELLEQARQAGLEAEKGGSHLNSAGLWAKRAQLLWLQGDPAAASALLDNAPPVTRDEDRCVLAWVRAAVALALGNTALATESLNGVDIQTDIATDMLAQVLIQRLALARVVGEGDAPARARAAELLSAGTIPALEAAQLRGALGTK